MRRLKVESCDSPHTNYLTGDSAWQYLEDADAFIHTLTNIDFSTVKRGNFTTLQPVTHRRLEHMPTRRRDPDREQRLEAFAQRLQREMTKKGWNGQDLAIAASKFVPDSHKDKKTGKRFELGRHLISAYLRAANEPTEANLIYIAKALGVKPVDLLQPAPGEGDSPQYATATSTLDGKTRLVIDAEVDAETALKVLKMIRENATSNATGAKKSVRAAA